MGLPSLDDFHLLLSFDGQTGRIMQPRRSYGNRLYTADKDFQLQSIKEEGKKGRSKRKHTIIQPSGAAILFLGDRSDPLLYRGTSAGN